MFVVWKMQTWHWFNTASNHVMSCYQTLVATVQNNRRAIAFTKSQSKGDFLRAKEEVLEVMIPVRFIFGYLINIRARVPLLPQSARSTWTSCFSCLLWTKSPKLVCRGSWGVIHSMRIDIFNELTCLNGTLLSPLCVALSRRIFLNLPTSRSLGRLCWNEMKSIQINTSLNKTYEAVNASQSRVIWIRIIFCDLDS